jgi:hypothetical protein
VSWGAAQIPGTANPEWRVGRRRRTAAGSRGRLRLGQSLHDQLVGVAHQLIDELPRHRVTSRTRSARALPSPETKAVAVALDEGVDEPGGPEPIREARRIDRLEHVADVQSAARRGVLPIGADKQTA